MRGRARWAAGQIGESAHPGQRVSAKDPLTARRKKPLCSATHSVTPHDGGRTGASNPMSASTPAPSRPSPGAGAFPESGQRARV